MSKVFYDEGWNACVRGEPYDPTASFDWRDGWLDCNSASEEDQMEIE